MQILLDNILYFTLLLISIGASAGAFLIINYLRRAYPLPYLESYFYYIILTIAFGIYAIWGVAFLRLMLEQINVASDAVSLFEQVIPYLGFPFLIMGWYMFIRFCYELTGSKVSGTASIIYFIFHLLLFIGMGAYMLSADGGNGPVSVSGLMYVYVILDLIFTVWGILILFTGARRAFPKHDVILYRYAAAVLVLVFMKVFTAVLYYFVPLVLPFFVLLYFLSIVLPVLYFYYLMKPVLSLEQVFSKGTSFENLLARYGITRREKEIIEQVCSGKSNQEIADTLFISLQTVKDHTHRIYLKMDIKSRVQLINMIQRSQTA